MRRPRPPAARRAAPARWPIVVVFLLLLAGATATLVDLRGDGDDGLSRRGSDELGRGEDLAVGAVPAEYRIVYEVRQPGEEPTTEVVAVSRPFEGRVEIRRGAPGDHGEIPPSGVIGERESTFAHLAVEAAAGPLVAVVGPRVAAQDLRFDAVLEDALDAGLLERRERRRVAGRVCQVFRAGTSVTAGELVAPADPAAEYADVCVDAAGLLLEEWWVVEGEPIRQRVAVRVDAGGIRLDRLLRLPRRSTIPVDRGGGGIREVRAPSAPAGEFWDPDPASMPAGFRSLGRYSLVPTQIEAFSDTSRSGSIVATTVDVWVRGPDLIVVEQGGSLGGGEILAPGPEGSAVDLGPLGSGEAVLRLDRVEIRTPLPGGRFLRVYGTVPLDDVVAVARSLVRTEGAGLEFLD